MNQLLNKLSPYSHILPRIGALLISVIMVGAIAMVHIKDGWQGNEWQLLILAVSLMYATKGNSINKGS